MNGRTSADHQIQSARCSRDQRWSIFLRNHAAAIIACDLCVVANATFRLLYELVVMEHASRRLIHLNVTAHPTAAWTLQRFREAIPFGPYLPVYSPGPRRNLFPEFDKSLANLGLKVVTTPIRSPQANALC